MTGFCETVFRLRFTLLRNAKGLEVGIRNSTLMSTSTTLHPELNRFGFYLKESSCQS
jgi:hypothetical protein